MAHIHLVKLSVGSDGPDDLRAWQSRPEAQTHDGLPRHITRMWPKREQELLDGGSIYWVMKGQITCRQTITRLDEITGHDGIRRCAIVLDPTIIPTAPSPKRAFQGWRYLQPQDAPPDISAKRQAEPDLPPELAGALADIGIL